MGVYTSPLCYLLVGIVSLFNLYAMSEYECRYFWNEKDPIIESAELLMTLLGYKKCTEGWKLTNPHDNETKTP